MVNPGWRTLQNIQQGLSGLGPALGNIARFRKEAEFQARRNQQMDLEDQLTKLNIERAKKVQDIEEVALPAASGPGWEAITRKKPPMTQSGRPMTEAEALASMEAKQPGKSFLDRSSPLGPGIPSIGAEGPGLTKEEFVSKGQTALAPAVEYIRSIGQAQKGAEAEEAGYNAIRWNNVEKKRTAQRLQDEQDRKELSGVLNSLHQMMQSFAMLGEDIPPELVQKAKAIQDELMKRSGYTMVTPQATQPAQSAQPTEPQPSGQMWGGAGRIPSGPQFGEALKQAFPWLYGALFSNPRR